MSSSGTGAGLGDAEAAAMIAAENLLSRDNIPDENQKTECFSCGEAMVGLFCHKCGQKNDDYRRSIWSLFSETFASIFSIENRIWRTWLMLLVKPGLVSREFSDGKRTRWTSPVRVYLALSIILFGYMSLTETRIFSIRTEIVPNTNFVGDVSDLEDSSVRLVPEFGFFRRQAEIDRLNSGTDRERVSRLMNGVPRQAFVFDGNLARFGDLPTNEELRSTESWPETTETENGELSENELRSLALKTYAKSVDGAVDKYNDILFLTKNTETIGDRIVAGEQANAPLNVMNEVKLSIRPEVLEATKEALDNLDGDLDRLGLSRSDLHALPLETHSGFTLSLGTGSINGVDFSETDLRDVLLKFLDNPALLNDGISRYLPRIMFLMMPFAALIGIIFIRGKKTALLYDHMVHATYIHAVTFAFLLALILMAQWTPARNMIQIFFIGIAIYLPLSAKTMFQRGWLKTFFASYSIAIFYGLAMFVVVTILTAQSIVDAADMGPISEQIDAIEALELDPQTTKALQR